MTVQVAAGAGRDADGNEAVIAGGLTPGMLVVSAGVHVLSPGPEGDPVRRPARSRRAPPRPR